MVGRNDFYPPVVINDASRNFLDHETMSSYIHLFPQTGYIEVKLPGQTNMIFNALEICFLNCFSERLY